MAISMKKRLGLQNYYLSKVHELERKVLKDGKDHLNECNNLTEQILKDLPEDHSDVLLFEENGKKYYSYNLKNKSFIRRCIQTYGAWDYLRMLKRDIVLELPDNPYSELEGDKVVAAPEETISKSPMDEIYGLGKAMKESVEKTKTETETE